MIGEHILLAMVTGLLSFEYKKIKQMGLCYLWSFNCCVWIANVVADVVKLIG